MRTSVASNVKLGPCLAVPLHDAVIPPFDRPVRVTSRSSTSPNAPGPGECRVAKTVASNCSPSIRQCPVYDIMVSRPLSVPSGASTTTPIPSASGVLNHTEYLPSLSTETFHRAECFLAANERWNRRMVQGLGVERGTMVADLLNSLRNRSFLPSRSRYPASETRRRDRRARLL
jgi:hypothetical protein